MADTIRSVRGMNDILPDLTPYWQSVETTVNEVLSSYGYQEIRFPIVEKTALFCRSIGEVTDIFCDEQAIKADGYLDLESLNTVAITGLDSYHTGSRLSRVSYAKPGCALQDLSVDGEI